MINEIEKDPTGLQRVHTACVICSSDREKNTKKKPWSLGSGTCTSCHGQYKAMMLSEGHIKDILRCTCIIFNLR